MSLKDWMKKVETSSLNEATQTIMLPTLKQGSTTPTGQQTAVAIDTSKPGANVLAAAFGAKPGNSTTVTNQNSPVKAIAPTADAANGGATGTQAQTQTVGGTTQVRETGLDQVSSFHDEIKMEAKPQAKTNGSLDYIIANHPHEHKMCQEGWGMDSSLFEALADHYYKEGRIPRSVWHGSAEELREFVENCYVQDTGMGGTQDAINNGMLDEDDDVVEGSGQQLSIQQLAAISDEALDNAYHYGRSSPGNTFGWQANMKSAQYAKQMIDRGVTDIEAISDAIHKGWNVTARAFVQNPDQFDDTAKLKAAGKLEAKLQQRAQLMKQNYAQLPNDEQEKDRVVARALLQALTGQQGMAENSMDPQHAFDLSPDLKMRGQYKGEEPSKMGNIAGTVGGAIKRAGTKFMDKLHPSDEKLRSGPLGEEMSELERSLRESTKEKTMYKSKSKKISENTGVTDDNPKSQGGTRKELLAKYAKSGSSADATAARKAGATQSELKAARSKSVSEGLKFQPDGKGNFRQKPGAFKDDPQDHFKSYREKQVADRIARGQPRRFAQQFDRLSVDDGSYEKEVHQYDDVDEAIELGDNELGMPKWYILDTNSEICSGPFDSREDASRNFKTSIWARSRTQDGSAAYDIAYGIEDDNGNFHEDERGVQESAGSKLKGKQGTLDVAPPKGKLTSADFKALGSKKKKVGEGKVFEESMADTHVRSSFESHLNKGLSRDQAADKVAKHWETTRQKVLDLTSDIKDAKARSSDIMNRAKKGLSGMYENGGKVESGKRIQKKKDAQMESWDAQLKNLLTEGMTVSTSVGNEGGKDSVSITANDADAHKLLQILQNAGISGQSAPQVVSTNAQPAQPATAATSPATDTSGGSAADASVEGPASNVSSMPMPRGMAFSVQPAETEVPTAPEEISVVDNEEVISSLGKEHGQSNKSTNGDDALAFLKKAIGHGTDYATGDAKSSTTTDADTEEEVAETDEDGKKPDEDGDGVPDWADKKEGKDDSEEADDSEEKDTEEADDEEDDSEEESEEADDEEEKVDEGKETCNECGGLMEDEHECSGQLNEWSNSPQGQADDEQFLADIAFLTKTLSGGLNKQKVDQTVMPHTKVKIAESKVKNTASAYTLELKKLAGI